MIEATVQQAFAEEAINKIDANRVQDTSVAHSMALAEQRVIDRHAQAAEHVAKALAADPSGIYIQPHPGEAIYANADVKQLRDNSAERVRNMVTQEPKEPAA